jgi:hypothetical protein
MTWVSTSSFKAGNMGSISGIRGTDPRGIDPDASQNHVETRPEQNELPTAADSVAASAQPKEPESTVLNHVLGGVQALWGAGQAIGGTVFAIGSAETVVGAVAGGAIAAHGVDDFQAGVRQMWTGKPVENLTQTLATEAAKKAGAGPLAAVVIGTAVDVAAGGPSGGVKKASEKFAKEAAEAAFKDAEKLGRDLHELERGAELPEGTHKIQGSPHARISASSKPSEILEKELERAGDPRPGPNFEPHHILPFDDSRVASVRNQLEELGVDAHDLNSAANGVWLPRGSQVANAEGAARHEFTFSNEYIGELKNRLQGSSSREDALQRLRQFGNDLRNGLWPPAGGSAWPRNQETKLR